MCYLPFTLFSSRLTPMSSRPRRLIDTSCLRKIGDTSRSRARGGNPAEGLAEIPAAQQLGGGQGAPLLPASACIHPLRPTTPCPGVCGWQAEAVNQPL